MERLKGKVAVVTGGSSGIGLAIAERFVEEGAHVYITGRRQKELDNAEAKVGKNVTAVQGDVSKLEDLDRLFEQLKTEKGQLDIVIANAGIVDPKLIQDADPEHYDRTFDINAKGLFYTVQKALPLLKAGASIVLIASVAAVKGMPGYGTYSATKAAVRSFARTWTVELKGTGIRVNTLSPGPIDTPIIDSQASTKQGADELRAMFSSMIPLARMGRADEIASAALFLASSDSSFIAGIDLQVDGGLAQV